MDSPGDTRFDTGAVRSGDASHLDFTSLPLVGLIGVARTAAEGATKYGRYNYMQGMGVHDLLNHVLRHVVLYLLGDRSEEHLPHAAWGCMAAIQSAVLNPELSERHMLGPGATLTEETKKHLDEHATALAVARKNGAFADTGKWSLLDLPEIKTLLAARRFRQELTPDPRDTWVGFPKEQAKDETSLLEPWPQKLQVGLASKARRAHYIPDDIDACERNTIG